MEFISEELDDYICRHTEAEPALLYELNRETNLKVLQPRMLSGHFQGRFLSMLSRLLKPANVLEIGTYTGYSALCFLEGLAPGGKITTIDINAELEDIVRKYIAKAGAEKQIDYLIGDARDLIPQLPGEFDFVFIDADKENYLTYYEMIVDRVKPGGIILTDNVLWSGKVLEELKPNDNDTREIIAYNERVNKDPRVESILLPIRDGLMLTRKK